MANQRKADRVVSAMQRRLRRAMDLGDIKKEDRSKLQKIDTELRKLEGNMSSFQIWEDNVVAEVNSLEHQVHRILSKFEAERDTDIGNINTELDRVHKTIEKLGEIAQRRPQEARTVDSNKGTVRRPVEENPNRRVPQEWLDLRVEEQILNTPALENLQESYFCLDSARLRLCFLSFSIFPENAVIKRRPLIYWWIAEGFVKAKERRRYRSKRSNEDRKNMFETAEKAGEDAFRRLLQLGLIEPHHGNPEEPHHDNPEKPGPVVNACKVPPWIRYMLISLAEKAEFLDFNWQGTPSYDSKSRRRCLVNDVHKQEPSEKTEKKEESGRNQVDNQETPGKKEIKEEDLLSVFNVGERYLDFEPAWLEKLKKVQILQLGRWQKSPEYHIEVVDETFLNSLGAPRHLKYLSLRGISRITTLPSSVLKLLDLEILDLKACHNLEKLPSKIGLLKKLTVLDVSDCPLLDSMPKGLGKLNALQVLKGFVIGNKADNYCRIADLANLENLRRLSVHIGNEAKVKDGELGHFKNIRSLRCLSVSWGVKSPAPHAMTDLSFPAKLEKLCLIGIPRLEGQTEKLKKDEVKAPADPMEQPPTEPTMEAKDAPDPGKPNPAEPKGKAKEASAIKPKRLLQDLKPSQLKHLKRLYIRGGELGSLDHEDHEAWKVEVLILKYLKNLNVEKVKLLADFPHLTYLAVKCEEKQQDFVWTKREIKKQRSTTEGKPKEEYKEDVGSKETRKLEEEDKCKESVPPKDEIEEE